MYDLFLVFLFRDSWYIVNRMGHIKEVTQDKFSKCKLINGIYGNGSRVSFELIWKFPKNLNNCVPEYILNGKKYAWNTKYHRDAKVMYCDKLKEDQIKILIGRMYGNNGS